MSESISAPIAFVVPSFDRGGLEQVVLNLYKYFRAEGRQCLIMVQENRTGAFFADVDDPDDVFVFAGDEAAFLSKLQERGVGVVHYHYSVFGLSAVRWLGFKTVYTVHNLYTWFDDAHFAAHAREVQQAHAIVAVSAYAKSYFCRRSGIDLDRVTVIGNGIDLAHLVPPPRVGFRQKMELSDTTFVFATIGSFHRNKHQRAAICAFEKLIALRDDVALLLLGGVGHPEHHREIVARVHASGASKLIRIENQVPPSAMAAIYGEVVDAIFLPSLQEGCSNVVLEGLALGKPMVLTSVGAAQEAQILSSDVVVVPPAYRDVLALDAAAIEELSRTDQPSNLAELVQAMCDVVDMSRTRSRDARTQAPSPGVRAALTALRMARAHLRIIDSGVPALAWN